jgi:heme-degrading monooxygenase HmoA
MPYVLIRHRVADYSKWKRAFDAHGSARRSGGSKGGRLFRSAVRPKEVFILLRWNDLRRAKKFTKSAALRKAMKGAGVRGKPDVFFLQEKGSTTV